MYFYLLALADFVSLIGSDDLGYHTVFKLHVNLFVDLDLIFSNIYSCSEPNLIGPEPA